MKVQPTGKRATKVPAALEHASDELEPDHLEVDAEPRQRLTAKKLSQSRLSTGEAMVEASRSLEEVTGETERRVGILVVPCVVGDQHVAR